jgi:hypothetical protein
MGRLRKGSRPMVLKRMKVIKDPMTIMVPWVTLITSITPQASEKPTAIFT